MCVSVAAAECHDRALPPIVLGADTQFSTPSSRLPAHVYRDEDGTLTPDQVIRLDRAGRFSLHCAAHAGVPAGGALWIRIDVGLADKAPENWAIVALPFEIDEFAIYRAGDGSSGDVHRSGRAVPASDRSLRSRWPAVPVTLGAGETARFYLKIAGASAPQVSLKILPASVLEAQDRLDLIVLSAFFGFMAAMFAVNIVLYFRGRHIQSVYYCLYLFLITAHVVVYDGAVYLWSPVPLYGHAADSLAQALGIIAGVALMLCGRALLNLPGLMPRTDRLVLLTGLLMVLALAAEIGGALPYALASSICLGVLGLAMTVSALVLAVRGSRSALYFFMSYLAIIGAFAVESLAYFRQLPGAAEPWLITLTENWTFQIGICVETVLIAFALSYFIRDMEGQVETVSRELETTAKKAGVRVRVESANPDATPKTSSDEAFFERALSIAQDNLGDENFGLDRLAAALGVSSRTLRRRIDAAAGLTPVEFLRQERLERGFKYLEAGTFKSVAEVARAVGIPNANYFSRSFRERFGVTPRAVLKKNGGD